MWSLIFAVLLYHSLWSHGELFNAISELEPLLETQKRIIHDLDVYTEKEGKRLLQLRSQLNVYRQEHAKAKDDLTNYLGNPINAFILIKRLTVDLDLIKDRIQVGYEYIQNITLSHNDVIYPKSVDLVGAVQAINRLKDTYRLDIHELSEGILNGVKYRTPLSASDCYELGRSLFLNTDKDAKNSRDWMMEAHRKFKESDGKELFSFTELDIVEKIGLLNHLLNDMPAALHWTNELLRIDPKHTGALRNLPHLKKLEAEKKAVGEKQVQSGAVGVQTKNVVKENNLKTQLSDYEETENLYEALCRGEMELPTGITTRLKCWYNNEHDPFLKYAPIKVEQMYIDPDIFIFYEVMTDNEIEHIKFMAQPKLLNAQNRSNGKFAHFRIGKVAWLKDQDSGVIARISERVAHMTGLNIETAEDLQVVNYGIGGHYEPHYDFTLIGGKKVFSVSNGNRIATVLFYMSDVAEGGATVFLELGLSLFPIKRAAVFWWNLHPSTEGDMSTLHAACPVLRGSKWVSNKWLHQAGQELIRPCNLELQFEGIKKLPPRPLPKTSS